MKTYRTDNQLRIVGKAWEVRYYLRMLLREAEHRGGFTADGSFLMKRNMHKHR